MKMLGRNTSKAKPLKPTRDAEGSIIKRAEERRTSNGKTRKEIVFYARVRYGDNQGKKREKKRRCDSYNNAIIKRRELQDEIKKELAEELEPERLKLFSEIIDNIRKFTAKRLAVPVEINYIEKIPLTDAERAEAKKQKKHNKKCR